MLTSTQSNVWWPPKSSKGKKKPTNTLQHQLILLSVQVHSSREEDWFRSRARLHNGNVPRRQGDRIRGTTIGEHSCALATDTARRHEPIPRIARHHFPSGPEQLPTEDQQTGVC